MTVEFSIQRLVSDGTLSTVALGIQYLQRNDIYMRIAGEETPQSGAPSGYTWSFIDNTTLKILPVVPAGVEVVTYRRTDVDAMYNIYSQNAQFDEATIDENNQQLLYIAQEYFEQGIPGAGVDSVAPSGADSSNLYYRLKLTDGSYTDGFAIPKQPVAAFYNVGTFAAGYVSLVNGYQTLTYNGHEYGWSGMFPVGGLVVPPESTPTPIGAGGWIDRSDITLRSELVGDVGAGLSGDVTRGHLLVDLVQDSSLAIGQSFRCADRADGIFDVVSSVTYPPNGYTHVLVTANTSLVLKLRVHGNTMDLEQAGGKPYIPGVQEVDCRQALMECFYAMLNLDSATVDLKSNRWLLSKYEFNEVKQRRKLRGDNATVYGYADDGVTNRDYLISTGWNYQDIEGITFDCQFNPRYACCLRILHGYGRYNDLTIRKSKCMLQVGLPDTNQVSLSEFMFHNLRGEENAKIAVVHGLYSVLNVSDSILPCGEGDFWKSYDCTGITVYGGRVFLVKCGCNSNVVDNDNPYVYLGNSTMDGNKYIGSFNALQCDFELRTRFCIVQDASTFYQDYQQSVSVTGGSRLAVYASLDARAKTLFEATNQYRGIFRIKDTDVHFDVPLSVAPIKAGGRTLVDVDYQSFYVPGFSGPRVVSWTGYPPLLTKGVVFHGKLPSDTVVPNSTLVGFSTTVPDLYGDTALCANNWSVGNKKFEVPSSGLSDVTVTARIKLAAPAAAAVTVIMEANSGTLAYELGRCVLPAGQSNVTLVSNIADLPPGYTLYVITDSASSYTLSANGTYPTNLAIEAAVKPPRTRT